MTTPPLPNFLILGVGKAGTTTLHYILEQHPDICLPRDKEAHFFDDDESYSKGLNFYSRAHFNHYAGQEFVGDITPAYFRNDRYIRRIRDALGPAIKLIVCFRFPVTRMYSHYIHRALLLDHNNSLEEEIARDESEDLVSASLYADRTKLLFDLFPRENILPLIFERDFLSQGSQLAIQKLQSFLGFRSHPAVLPPMHESKGYLPFVGMALRECSVRTEYGERSCQALGLVVERLEESKFFDVRSYPATDIFSVEWLCKYASDVTRSIDRDQLVQYYNRLYSRDVEELKRLLNDPIPEWSLDTVPIPSYSVLAPRISSLLSLEGISPHSILALRATFGTEEFKMIAGMSDEEALAMIHWILPRVGSPVEWWARMKRLWVRRQMRSILASAKAPSATRRVNSG